MRWQQGRRSTNVDDRRGQKVKKAGTIGGGTALLMGGLGLLLGVLLPAAGQTNRARLRGGDVRLPGGLVDRAEDTVQ